MYKFIYFNKVHIEALVLVTIICTILLIIPHFLDKKRRRYFEIFLGIFLLFTKLFDALYRVYVEGENFIAVIPLNLCNVALILGGIYLIYKNTYIFNIVYFWVSGAILAVILPGINTYNTKFYVFIFIFAHMIEIFVVIYTFIYTDEKITKLGLLVAILAFLLLNLISYFVNIKLGTNYMFINDYILSMLSFMPINIYRILYLGIFIISMIIVYLPFIHINKIKKTEL